MEFGGLGLDGPLDAVEWLIRVAALFVVPYKRLPAATRTWLLFIFFLPIPGALLFAAIGTPRFPKWRRERGQRLLPVFAALDERLKADAPPGPETDGEIAAFARVLGRLPATGGNSVELLPDYDAAIGRLIADIDGARTSVWLETYIFAEDKVGDRVIEALIRAAGRGVRCHVLIDALGSHSDSKSIRRRLDAAGIAAREALPVRWGPWRTRRDMRNHRKLAVIDGSIGFAGSQNVVIKECQPDMVNRELMARVTGPVVAELALATQADWFLETEEPVQDIDVPAATGAASAQLLLSGADFPIEGFQTLLVWQLHRSRERVVITTPYFIPDETLLEALESTAARGVRVDLILSDVTDQRLVKTAQCSYYAEMMECGVNIHLYPREFLHAKHLRVDRSLGVVGSSNVDLRSFQLNEEVSLLLYDTASIDALIAVQDGYLDISRRLDKDAWNARPWWRKLAENLARLVSPLL